MIDFFKSRERKLTEKAERYISLEKSLNEINEEIDDIANDFSHHNTLLTKAIEQEQNEDIRQKLEQKYSAFTKNHLKRVREARKNKLSITKSMNNLLKNSEDLSRRVEDYKHIQAYQAILKSYRDNHLTLNQCDILLKAAQHKYIRRTPDGKGGWNYVYEESKEKEKGKEDIGIGFEFTTGREENMRVVGIKKLGGEELFEVVDTSKSNPMKDLMSLEDIQSEIKFAKEQLPQLAEREIKDKIESEKEKQNKKEYDDLDGFGNNFSSMKLGKVKASLNKEIHTKQGIKTRKSYIKDKLQEGYSVGINGLGEKVLMSKDGSWIGNKNFVNKTALEYAEFLQSKKENIKSLIKNLPSVKDKEKWFENFKGGEVSLKDIFNETKDETRVIFGVDSNKLIKDKKISLDDLIPSQPTVSKDVLINKINKSSDNLSNPVIGIKDGKKYIISGHHRLALSKLKGDYSAKADIAYFNDKGKQIKSVSQKIINNLDGNNIQKSQQATFPFMQPYLDTINEALKNKKVTGKIKYADNIVWNEEGKILFLKRSEQDKTFPGKFTLPGGHVDPGEECEEAAKRELYEEAGIEVEEVTQVGEYEDEKVQIKYYESHTENAEPRLQQEETWTYEWKSVSEIPDMDLPLNMGENLMKILNPLKMQVVSIKKALEEDSITKDQYRLLMQSVISKAHKYVRRTGTPGNYKYHYEDNRDDKMGKIEVVGEEKDKNNFQKIKDYAEQVIKGEKQFERLSPEEEQGRITGGRANVEATILIGTDAGASDESKEPFERKPIQEKLIEDYSKRNKLWIGRMPEFNSNNFIDSGAEAKVYKYGNNKVIKINNLSQHEEPIEFLDRIALHNILFPDTKYEVVGFGRFDGDFSVIVKQPFIEDNSKVKVYKDDIRKEMEAMGFEHNGGNNYISDDYLVEDLHAGNVLNTKYGFSFIDPIIYLNKKDDGYGGKRKLGDININDTNSILNKALEDNIITPKQYTLLLEKAKPANIGEIREWSGKKMKKVAPDKWEEVKESKESKKIGKIVFKNDDLGVDYKNNLLEFANHKMKELGIKEDITFNFTHSKSKYGGGVTLSPNPSKITKIQIANSHPDHKKIIAHELTHIKQINNNELFIKDNNIIFKDNVIMSVGEYRKKFKGRWNKKKIEDYMNLPWEKESFDAEKEINIINKSEEDDLQKAWESAKIGEVRTHKDGKKYRKVSQTGNSRQDWKLVTKDKAGNQEPDSVSKEGSNRGGEEGKQSDQANLSEAAKNASETALNNAIKQSDDPKVREAAHQEIDRREKEEKPQDEADQKQGEEEKKESKEEDKKDKPDSGKEDYDSKIKELENKIRELRNEDIDYSDTEALEENTKQVQEAMKKRQRLVSERDSLQKVPFEEYMKGFKDFDDLPSNYYVQEGKKSVWGYLKEKPEIKSSIDYYVGGSNYKKIREILTKGDIPSIDSDLEKTKERFDEINKELDDKYKDLSFGEKMRRKKKDKEYVESLEKINKNKPLKAINDISTFIQNNKIKDNLVLNRRIKGEGVKFFESLEKGDIYEDKSFSSTSLGELTHFGDFNISILAKKGSNVANIDNPGELEYLIDKGSKFRVLDKNDNNIIVELL